MFRDVFWDLGVEYEGLAIGAELASGTSDFDVQEHLFESSFIDYDLTGEFEWDGESHSVVYSAWYTGQNLNELSGSVDGVELSWETSSPDLP